MKQAPDSGVLFQEELKDEPFWMLVACILVNRTHWRQAKPVLKRLREMYPRGATDLAIAEHTEVYEIVASCGFGYQRTKALISFACDWVRAGPPKTHVSVRRYAGCGKYAEQSWMIFIDGIRPAGDVTDHKLQWYLDQHPETV